MVMKILLMDVDSKMPNLALMKISSYHKSKGDIIGFDVVNPDIIYASIIFKTNKHKADELKCIYPNSKIIIGGSGYDINIKLPDEIEFIKPDYSLYNNCNFSLGYTTRGCDRACYFCIVNKKEGNFKIWQHPSEFYDSRFKEIIFLDNNILFSKERFKEVINFCAERSLKVQFNQGLDIRLLNEEDIKYLTKVDHKSITFTWDNINIPNEKLIREKIQLLKNNNIDCRQFVNFYVYINDDSEFESGLYRCRILKSLGVNSFVMFNRDKERTQRIKELQRWANKRQIY